jgi:hypothetical protein
MHQTYSFKIKIQSFLTVISGFAEHLVQAGSDTNAGPVMSLL